MGRNELFKKKKDKIDALIKIQQKYKDPDTIKYDLVSEAGEVGGYVEYFPKNDLLYVSCGSVIPGGLLKIA